MNILVCWDVTLRGWTSGVQTFCIIILTLSSSVQGYWAAWTLRKKVPLSFETSRTTRPKTQHHIISYHIISYHIISYHIISYHIISYHIISYIISYIIYIRSYHIISCIISYHISYHIYIYIYHVTSYHITS